MVSRLNRFDIMVLAEFLVVDGSANSFDGSIYAFFVRDDDLLWGTGRKCVQRAFTVGS